MLCSCVATTPKGIRYRPSLKSIYERVGAKGEMKKTGYKCPKCPKFYDLEGKEV